MTTNLCSGITELVYYIVNRLSFQDLWHLGAKQQIISDLTIQWLN